MAFEKISIRLGMNHGLYICLCIGFISASLITLIEHYVLSLGTTPLIATATALIFSALIVIGIILQAQNKAISAADRYAPAGTGAPGIPSADSVPCPEVSRRTSRMSRFMKMTDPATLQNPDTPPDSDEGPSAPAVSTLVGVILMILLIITLAVVMYAMLFGLISTVERTAYVVTDAVLINLSPGIQGISVSHRNGDIIQYEGLTTNPLFEVRFEVDNADQSAVVGIDPALLKDTAWSPGNRVIIFKNSSGYYLTDDPTKITGAIPLPPGPNSVRVIDNTHHQLIAYLEAGTGEIAPTAVPTPIPTTVTPTATPTPAPAPSQNCVNCGAGESFTVSFRAEARGTHTIRFKDDSHPQPNTRNWVFGDGGSASGELIDHTFPASGTYQITLTVKKNNSPCTCTITRQLIVA